VVAEGRSDRGAASVAGVTRAQLIFAVALAAATVVITAVGVYVASSAFWADRWYRRSR